MFTLGKFADSVPSHPYIRTILDTCDGAEWDDTSRARGIYFLFARLASEVKSSDIESVQVTFLIISDFMFKVVLTCYVLGTTNLAGHRGSSTCTKQ